MLGDDEEFLWPRPPKVTATGAASAAAELVAVYPYRAEVEPARWWRLIEQAEEQIDLLGYTLYFLPQQHPGLGCALMAKGAAGCRIRIVLADPNSPHLADRDVEEAQPITLIARLRTTMDWLGSQPPFAGLEVRLQDAPLYNSLFRFDSQMFVTPHLYRTPGHAAPLMHLRRVGSTGLFARFATHFEDLWETSTAWTPWPVEVPATATES
jgi:hypothetical protein